MAVASVIREVVSSIESSSRQAEDIPPVSPEEAAQLATEELRRALDLLEQLQGDDWTQATDCTEWNVRDMTAHLAGGCAGWASWGQFLRQAVFNRHMPRANVPVDAINRRQLEDRAGRSPRELIEELRRVGPKAIQRRLNLPGFLRRIRIPATPLPGKMTLAYLVDVIYPRDEWMHRMDICRATGKALTVTPEHDGRLLDLVLLDMAGALNGRLALILKVSGAVSASYRLGRGEALAEINIDYLTLNRRASGRISADEALQSAVIRGDEAVARDFLQHCEVLY